MLKNTKKHLKTNTTDLMLKKPLNRIGENKNQYEKRMKVVDKHIGTSVDYEYKARKHEYSKKGFKYAIMSEFHTKQANMIIDKNRYLTNKEKVVLYNQSVSQIQHKYRH